MSARRPEDVAEPTGWVAARVVVVDCPEYPGRPGSALGPAYGDEDVWLRNHSTLKAVEGPLVNGLVIFTWEEDPASDDELVRRSVALVAESARNAYANGRAT